MVIMWALLTRVLTVVNFVFALRRFAAGLWRRPGRVLEVVKKAPLCGAFFEWAKALRPALLPNVE